MWKHPFGLVGTGPRIFMESRMKRYHVWLKDKYCTCTAIFEHRFFLTAVARVYWLLWRGASRVTMYDMKKCTSYFWESL